ncbi:MAG: glycosyl hydrolase family 65 protein [Candidatus Competibacteraceae bacterium]|nr:glycosyl hydrolase family 65 protein [Candidatus Competibacteraceae bacterium]
MSDWSLVYQGYDPDQEPLREALCVLGNGYFATRGADPGSRADGTHYPGTYLAGGYNRLATEIRGHVVENEDLVNLPNWLPLTFRIDDGDWLQLDRVNLLDYRQELDLRRGVLERCYRLEDGQGHRTRVLERRLVHMAYRHLAALELTLEAENWSGRLEVRSALDGRVENTGVARYRALNQHHLETLEAAGIDPPLLFLRTRTRQSRLEVALAARTRLYRYNKVLEQAPRLHRDDHLLVAHYFDQPLQQGEALRVEKTVALYTSRDQAISEPGLAARQAVAGADDFANLLEEHSRAWQRLWRRFDLEVDFAGGATTPDGKAIKADPAMILRLHIFHLLQTASPHTMELDVGVPARGLHGEAYRGHILWDELIIFPFLNLRLPEITRSLLMYRYHRLAAARAAAREAGCRGAMFPWQSGSDGREESQKLHLNPQSGRWIADNSRRQRHVNAAIAYNLWRYYQTTADLEFLSSFGAEMILEIARFWASISTFSQEKDRYEIRGVMGPDEFHDAYPDRDEPGLDNNAYTNVMATWVLSTALRVLETIPGDRREELEAQLELGQGEREHWADITRRMFVPFHGEGIISQFEGFGKLREFDWQGYREKYGNIQRLDRILESEDDTPNRYQVAKQADVLMLFFLFSAEELAELFGQLGYDFDPDIIPRNIDYYLRRTSHGSTLSRVVHAWVLARSDRARAWRLFTEALQSDVADIQGGTTPEGIHLGAMAGSVDLVQRGFTGIVTRDDVLWLNPCLPQDIHRLTLYLRYRGQSLKLTITHDKLHIETTRGTAKAVRIGVHDQIIALGCHESREFKLN